MIATVLKVMTFVLFIFKGESTTEPEEEMELMTHSPRLLIVSANDHCAVSNNK